MKTTEWHSQYQGTFEPIPDDYYLALRYAVRTEQFDRTLPHVIERGEARVRPDCYAESCRNARAEQRDLKLLCQAVGADDKDALRLVGRLPYEEQVHQLALMPENLRQMLARMGFD